jgi:ubiquinone biosynthesis protein
MDWGDVASILDREIPQWRKHLRVQPVPLGVASMAQVHEATDMNGKEWVVKIIKPQARLRLTESLAALHQMITACTPIALTQSARRGLKELRELSISLERELDLNRERETIVRMHQKLEASAQSLLRIPEVNEPFCTNQVLVIERFRGTPLSKVVANHQVLSQAQRRKLAKGMLQELLVQVFEIGLFHADPHAGNLILLEDGSVGLFDWGLAGELLETDRQHIAGMLKAVIALDMERLIDVLLEMAREGGRTVRKTKVRKEMMRLSQLVKRGEENPDQKPGLHELIEASLDAAARLDIPIPSGLLLMAKSLITIEGLAKGIDPDVSLKRIATPVLFKAARPTIDDVVAMAKRLPTMVKKLF